jgi:hypothetical protein
MAFASLVAIVGVNLLVLVKYAPRVGIPAPALAVSYVAVVVAGAFAARRGPLLAPRIERVVFWVVVACSVVAYLVVLDRIPPLSLNVDRWSAITSFNERLLEGKYPYEARTHLGSRVSGLPVVFALGLPFQWAGDVGYLQVFFLAAFAAACWRQSRQREGVVWPMLFLVTSPAFAWEVAARSDLVTNAFVAVLLLFLCERWKREKTMARMVVLGVVGGLVASTRLVVVLPLTVYFVGYFERNERRWAGVMAGAAAATFAATLVPFAIWDTRLFLAYNPLAWQGGLAPLWVQVAAGVAAVVAGMRTGGVAGKCGAAGLIVVGTVLAAFLLSAATPGVVRAPAFGHFDISYFDFALPFLIVPLVSRGGGR